MIVACQNQVKIKDFSHSDHRIGNSLIDLLPVMLHTAVCRIVLDQHPPRYFRVGGNKPIHLFLVFVDKLLGTAVQHHKQGIFADKPIVPVLVKLAHSVILGTVGDIEMLIKIRPRGKSLLFCPFFRGNVMIARHRSQGNPI